MFNIYQKKNLIKLTVYEMFNMGLHLGHTVNNSDFYARWMVLGYVKKKLFNDFMSYKFFFLNLMWTRLGIYSISELIDKGSGWKSVWYICHFKKFTPVVLKYGFLLGEVVNGLSTWIAGSLTNYKYVLLYVYIILLYLKEGFKLNYKHKKRLLSYLGLCLSRLSLPFLVFFFKLLILPVAVKEGIHSKVISIGLVDSDIRSGVKIPLIVNDDSLLSINFFLYFFSKKIYVSKLLLIKKWRKSIRKTSVRKSVFVYWFYLFYQLNFLKNKSTLTKVYLENFLFLNKFLLKNKMREKFDWTYLTGSLSKNNFSFIIYNNDVITKNYSDKVLKYNNNKVSQLWTWDF